MRYLAVDCNWALALTKEAEGIFSGEGLVVVEKLFEEWLLSTSFHQQGAR